LEEIFAEFPGTRGASFVQSEPVAPDVDEVFFIDAVNDSFKGLKGFSLFRHISSAAYHTSYPSVKANISECRQKPSVMYPTTIPLNR
jgi:hypothetical protein